MCPSKENICAIVVTYFPDQGLYDRVTRTKAQVAHVVIVDNASDEDTFKRVQGLCEPGIDVIRNPVNLGIAAALNQGLLFARDKGYPWVLCLDQDTVPDQDMVPALLKVLDEFPDESRIAMVGSGRVLHPGTKRKRSQNERWAIAETVITSGSLLQVNAAQKIGPFREEFFIDCVDFEYCLRARSMGFKIIEILAPKMQHTVGNPRTLHMLWWKTHAYNHRPWRSYYIVRNFVVLIREYILKEPWWIIRMGYATAKAMTVAVFLEESRILKLRYSLVGFYDGLVGRFTRRVI